ncbi:MAG: AAA family ATPase [Verrucomicrobiae bacterium]|nr:AAA family ATPase [Verrucomicrobiae bacterium]
MAKCPCQHCGQPLEFPEELAGQGVACPSCGQSTQLDRLPVPILRIPAARGSGARTAVSTPVNALAHRILDNVETVVLGKRPEILRILVALLSEGHVLIEDVPGVAKTMVARALAQSVGGTFKRIQGTPDLLPSDITGTSVFDPRTTMFDFRPGPLFAQFVLADEINRATPRAQAALLEAMAERAVTVDGAHRPLERPFFLIATQNPVDHEGTFPLPEAQLDRFLIRLSLGYPTMEEEGRMLERLQLGHPIERLEPVVTAEELVAAQDAVRAVPVEARVREYILRLVRATREHDAVRLGGSPRASLALFRAAQALAAIQGYDFALPDDVKELAPAVLSHRLVLRPESRLRKATAASVIDQVLDRVPVPTLGREG